LRDNRDESEQLQLQQQQQQQPQEKIHVVNFVKLSLLASRLREFQSTQQTPFSFSPVANVAQFFENELVVISLEQLFLISKQVEPAAIVREYKRNQQILAAQEDNFSGPSGTTGTSSVSKPDLGSPSAGIAQDSANNDFAEADLINGQSQPTEDQERAKKETKKLEKELRKFEREFETGTTTQFLRGSIQYGPAFTNVNNMGGTLKQRQKLRRVLTMQSVNAQYQPNQ